MSARQRWRVWYRLFRIIRRESHKATLDMMLFGTGYVMLTTGPDYIRHVPIEKVVIRW